MKSKEVKTRWSNSRWNRKIWQNLLRIAMAQMDCFASGGGDDRVLLK